MKKALPLITLIILSIVAIVIKNYSKDEKLAPSSNNETTNHTSRNAGGLNRNPSQIHYSRHASCRMQCRHIDKGEVRQILKEGKINYNKSDLKGDECRKKYAVEGITRDKQKVRIIFASCNSEITVVTVIDLGKEWVCNCDEMNMTFKIHSPVISLLFYS